MSLSNNFGRFYFTPGDIRNDLVDLSANTVEFSLPIELLGSPQDDWEYFVGVGLATDRTMTFLDGGPAPVHEEHPVFINGGNFDNGNPAFIDILLPEEVDQVAVLGDYDADIGRLAVVQMVRSGGSFAGEIRATGTRTPKTVKSRACDENDWREVLQKDASCRSAKWLADNGMRFGATRRNPPIDSQNLYSAVRIRRRLLECRDKRAPMWGPLSFRQISWTRATVARAPRAPQPLARAVLARPRYYCATNLHCSKRTPLNQFRKFSGAPQDGSELNAAVKAFSMALSARLRSLQKRSANAPNCVR